MSSAEINRMDFVAARGVPRLDGQRGEKQAGDDGAPSFGDVVARMGEAGEAAAEGPHNARGARREGPASDGLRHLGPLGHGERSDAALKGVQPDRKNAGQADGDDPDGDTAGAADDAAARLAALMLAAGLRPHLPAQRASADAATGNGADDGDADTAADGGSVEADGPLKASSGLRSRLVTGGGEAAGPQAVLTDAKDGKAAPEKSLSGAENPPAAARDGMATAGGAHRNTAAMMPGLLMARVASAVPLPAEAGASRLARLSAELQTTLSGAGSDSGGDTGQIGAGGSARLAGGKDPAAAGDTRGGGGDRASGQDGDADGRLGRDGLLSADPKAGPVADAGRATAGPAMHAPAVSGNAQTIAASIADAPDWQAALRPASLSDPAARPPGTVNALRIQLNPADLGLVTATLRMSGERLTIELRVETREAYRQLSNDHEAIAEKLKGHGYVVDQIRVHQVAGDRSIATQAPAGGQADNQLQGQHQGQFQGQQQGGSDQRALAGGGSDGRRPGDGSAGGDGGAQRGGSGGRDADADALAGAGRARGLYL